jgi:hypothetical protein
VSLLSFCWKYTWCYTLSHCMLWITNILVLSIFFWFLLAAWLPSLKSQEHTAFWLEQREMEAVIQYLCHPRSLGSNKYHIAAWSHSPDSGPNSGSF